jgi:hypothetical protein
MSERLPDMPLYARQRVDNRWEGADHPSGPWKIISPDGIHWAPWGRPTAAALQQPEKPNSVSPEPVRTPLSPAAQAVLDAFHKELPPDNQPGGLPAALRAAADQVVRVQVYMTQEERSIRNYLLAIAAELEGGHD